MKSIGAIAVTLFTVVAGFAQASDVDWRVYGGDRQSICFYEANGVVRGLEGHIRVWTKCLFHRDMGVKLSDNSISKAVEKRLKSKAEEKRLSGYVPPIPMLQEMGNDTISSLLLAEEIANTGLVKPNGEIFYELSCSDRRLRELSVRVYENNGEIASTNKPLDWKYVPPEGNAAILLKILCHA